MAHSYLDPEGLKGSPNAAGIDKLLSIDSYDIIDQAGVKLVASRRHPDIREHLPNIGQYSQTTLNRQGYQIITPVNGASTKLVVLPDTYGMSKGSAYHTHSTNPNFDAPRDSNYGHVVRNEEYMESALKLAALGVDRADLSKDPDMDKAHQAINEAKGVPGGIDATILAKIGQSGFNALMNVVQVLQRPGDASKPDDPNHAELAERMGQFKASLPPALKDKAPDIKTMPRD